MTMASAQLPYQDPNLTPEERAADLLPRLTLDEKISLMMDVSPSIPRLGIPEYNWWNEALHGVGRAGIATVFPQCVGLAATFDTDGVYEAFTATSDEARAKFNDFNSKGQHDRYKCLSFWTPNVNIFRDPRWGRGQETYGEDPYLTSRMGEAVVHGLQGNDPKYLKTLAGAKHYAVHSGPEWSRHSFDAAVIDPRDLWETYLPSFKALVDADVWQVMCAYNRFEGEPCCSNKKLLQQILREQWGYKHIVVTDCWALCDLYEPDRHATYPNQATAAAAAVVSGTDLECGPILANLKDAYKKGLITEEVIDRSVMRLLTARFALGELCGDETPWSGMKCDEVVDCQAHRDLALRMAQESMVLLKNNGILPLPKQAAGLIVMGSNANDSVMQWGNYNGFPSATITILDGIRQKAGDVPYLRACDLVVNSNAESKFNNFSYKGKPGMRAQYWNGTKPKGKPVTTEMLTVPANFTNGGATVFAPGVDLYKFYAKYDGTFVADEDGEYVLSLFADPEMQIVTINGKKVLDTTTLGDIMNHTYSFEAKKGEKFNVTIEYMHQDPSIGADLKFDLGIKRDYVTDPGDAEVVIFVGGISPHIEGEEMPVNLPGFRGGDRVSIELPAVQRELIKQLKDQGKKVVFVNCSGSAIALAPEDEICDAIVQAWYPGQAGGAAVADVLFGDYNPSGRLPVTFYRDDSQLPEYSDYSMDGRTYRFMTDKPLYPFGHGLSYTQFAYADVGYKSAQRDGKDGLEFTITVKNTGDKAGQEVAQLYVQSQEKGVMAKALKGFQRTPLLEPGQEAVVTFFVPRDEFKTYNYATKDMEIVDGAYDVFIGPSSDKCNVTHVVKHGAK